MARWLVLAAIAGCYSEPRPACGFVCGDGGACQSGYTCSAADNRCHLDGTSVECDSYVDASPDADTTPPTVMMMSPTGNGAPVNVPIELVFSEPVMEVAAGMLVTWPGLGDIAGTVTVTQTTPFTTDFTPTVPFPGSSAIVVQVRASITDFAGNHLLPTGWIFTTAADPTPLVVTATTPVDGDTNVFIGTEITVTFNKYVGTFTPTSITVDPGVTGTTHINDQFSLGFTQDANLATATTYTVTVATDIADTSGVHLAAPFSFSFTTM